MVALKWCSVWSGGCGKGCFSLAVGDVESDVLLLSHMHITAFSIDKQLYQCSVICLATCQWGAVSSHWCHGQLYYTHVPPQIW